MKQIFSKKSLFLWFYLVALLLGGIGYLLTNFFNVNKAVNEGIVFYIGILPLIGISIAKLVETLLKFDVDKLLENYKESIKANYNNREQAKQIAKFLSLARKYAFLKKMLDSKKQKQLNLTVDEVDSINNVIVELNTLLWELYLILPTSICLKLNVALQSMGQEDSDITVNDIVIQIKEYLRSEIKPDNQNLEKEHILGAHHYTV